MTYTVVWLPSVEARLAGIWLDATDRELISATSREIDKALKKAPMDIGESRVGDSRIAYFGPLAIYFDINEEDRQVIVWALWLTSDDD